MTDPTGGVLSSNPAVGGSAADENRLASQSVNTASDRTICFALFLPAIEVVFSHRLSSIGVYLVGWDTFGWYIE
jgi:hypothetical protein